MDEKRVVKLVQWNICQHEIFIFSSRCCTHCSSLIQSYLYISQLFLSNENKEREKRIVVRCLFFFFSSQSFDLSCFDKEDLLLLLLISRSFFASDPCCYIFNQRDDQTETTSIIVIYSQFLIFSSLHIRYRLKQ